jgi:hypothetical protein
MKFKFLKEPLLHFLLLGAGLFVLFAWVGSDDSLPVDQRSEIVITTGRINSIGATFEKVWQRPPTPQELAGLVEDFIREEIMYREALAMGLDQDDTIVRRRMRQKIEFLSDDVANLKEPTEDELESFLSAYPKKFREEDQFSFTQVYFNVSERGEEAVKDATDALEILRSGKGDAGSMGDSIMIEKAFKDLSGSDLERIFGPGFRTSLASVPVGSWEGPIQSGYGLHLVYFASFVEGSVPPLDQVRDKVQREWAAQKRKEFSDAFYTRLRERYIITVEGS